MVYFLLTNVPQNKISSTFCTKVYFWHTKGKECRERRSRASGEKPTGVTSLHIFFITLSSLHHLSFTCYLESRHSVYTCYYTKNHALLVEHKSSWNEAKAKIMSSNLKKILLTSTIHKDPIFCFLICKISFYLFYQLVKFMHPFQYHVTRQAMWLIFWIKLFPLSLLARKFAFRWGKSFSYTV